MKPEKLLPVIIGKLFARLDCAQGKDANATIADPDLAIGSARVVDEACSVCRNISVDHASGTRPEEVLPAIVLNLFGCGGAPEVLYYE
jgi:hypothetical protein